MYAGRGSSGDGLKNDRAEVERQLTPDPSLPSEVLASPLRAIPVGSSRLEVIGEAEKPIRQLLVLHFLVLSRPQVKESG